MNTAMHVLAIAGKVALIWMTVSIVTAAVWALVIPRSRKSWDPQRCDCEPTDVRPPAGRDNS